MWNHAKPINAMSRAEIELQETFEYVRELEYKLQKLQAVVDNLYIKAQISHSLLVIRKIDEGNADKLNQLLD